MAQFDEITEVALGNFGLVTASQAKGMGIRSPLDFAEIREMCIRLFLYRKRQTWPPDIVLGNDWNFAYEAALETVKDKSALLPTAAEAVQWANALILEIDSVERQ